MSSGASFSWHSARGALWALFFLAVVEVLGLRAGYFWCATAESSAFAGLVRAGAPPQALFRNLALAARNRRQGILKDGVLIIGSSVAEYGVDRPLLQQILGLPTHIAWEGAANFDLIEDMTDLLLRHAKPAIVVLAASPHQALQSTDPSDLLRQGWYCVGAGRERGGTLAEAVGARVWQTYRYRGALREFLNLAGLRALKVVAGVAGPSAPPVEFDEGPANEFVAWRAAWQATGSLSDYWLSMQQSVGGAETAAWYAARCRTDFARAPHQQWPAAQRWVDTVRAAGAQPVIIAFPLNPMLPRDDFGYVVFRRRATPIMPPQMIAGFVNDLGAIADEKSVPFFNAIDREGPESFYDFHHLIPAARERFTHQIAEWILEAPGMAGAGDRSGTPGDPRHAGAYRGAGREITRGR